MAGSQHLSRWKRAVQAILGQPCLKNPLELRRRCLCLELLDESFPFVDVGVDAGLVVEIVGEGRVDLGERDRGMGRDDFIGIHAHSLVANCDVLDFDAVPIDSRLAAARTRGTDYAGRIKRLYSRRAGFRFHAVYSILEPCTQATRAVTPVMTCQKVSRRRFGPRATVASVVPIAGSALAADRDPVPGRGRDQCSPPISNGLLSTAPERYAVTRAMREATLQLGAVAFKVDAARDAREGGN